MFHARLTECAERVSGCLRTVFSELEKTPLVDAMAYGVTGGKCMRAFLVMESARLFGIPDSQSVWAASAVEAMHGYSLIHDDLPCMDDDDLRRGHPTVHVKWDEATAVLAGDALQSLAFELLARPELAADPVIRLTLCASMARASGAKGMVIGQAQDIAAETARKKLTLDEITVLQGNKTGALIGWSCEAGAVLAAQDPAQLRAYSCALGLAFQIADDILDVEGNAELAGKAVGKDARAGKATFVSLLGLETAKQRARALVDDAQAMLEPYGAKAQVLRDAAGFVISREL